MYNRTNIRPTQAIPVRPPGTPSRGQLLRNFLSSPEDQLENLSSYISSLSPLEAYEGFNLLLFQIPKERNKKVEIRYISNKPNVTLSNMDESDKEAEIVKGISNTPLDQPWPKVIKGKQKMQLLIEEESLRGKDGKNLLIHKLFEILR